MLNTIKNVFRTLFAVMGFYRGDNVEDIFNYMSVTEKIFTSGVLKKHQLKAICKFGVTTVINLLPDGSLGSLENERSLVEDMGMRYIYIPVDGGAPSHDDFREFVHALQSASGERIWIHCAANARVSVFLYKYRVSVLKEDEEKAREDLQKIWEPMGVWKKFMLEDISIDL